MPWSDQQCSSSPMSSRFGSAERVVLPVPERPNSSDERPFSAVGGRRAVHREDALAGHQIVHDGEDALLHLAGVLGAEDDRLASLEVEVDAGLRRHPFGQAIGGELAGVVDDEVRLAEVSEFLGGWADEHRVHEQGVIRPRADDADLQPILGVPAGEGIDAVEPPAGVEVVAGALAVDLEAAGLHRDVHRPPPDVALRLGVPDDPLVLRRPARLRARVGDQRPGPGNPRPRIVTDRVLIELGRAGLRLISSTSIPDALSEKRSTIPSFTSCALRDHPPDVVPGRDMPPVPNVGGLPHVQDEDDREANAEPGTPIPRRPARALS